MAVSVDASDAAVGPETDTATQSAEPGETFWRRHAGLAIWLAICLVALVFLDHLHAPLTFYYDEWSVVLDRRTGGLDTLLTAHNGHLTLLPLLAFRTLFSIFGLDHYRPFRVAGLLVHVFVASMVYQYVRSRLGLLTGLALGSLVLLLGAAWEDILWPWQMGFMGSVGLGILAWLALDQKRKWFDVLASVAVGASLACSGLGIPVLIGTTARLAAERSWRRLIAVLAPPAGLYGLWYLKYGQSQGKTSNIKLMPRYVVDEAGSSVGALLGRDILWGHLLLGVILGVVMVAALTGRRIAICVIAPAVAMIANWLLVAYSRADLNQPGSSRYVYVGAVYLIVVAADALKPWRGRQLSYGAVAFSLVGLWGNWAPLHQGADNLRWFTGFARSDLRAVEWAADTVAPDYRPSPFFLPPVTAGKYLDAVRDLGSPAASDGEVESADNQFRSEADRVSIEALRMGLTDGSPPTAVTTTTVTGDGSAITLDAGQCASVEPDPAGQVVAEIVVPEGSALTIGAGEDPVEVRLRRYADGPPASPNFVVDAGTWSTLAIPNDLAPRTEWTVTLTSNAALTACTATA